MKNTWGVFSGVILLFCACSQFAFADGVSVSEPANNSTVGTTFTLQASSATCSGQPVATMAYSFGTGGLSPVVDSTSMDVQATASVGDNQILHVKSWGDKGASCDTNVTVNVATAYVQDGITINTPALNSNVSSPFTLQASATTCNGSPVATMAYSLNSSSQLSTVITGTSMNVQVSTSAGQQIVHVKTWNTHSVGCVADLTINVSGTTASPSPSPTPSPSSSGTGFDGSSHIPSPPSTSRVVTNIQQLSKWAGKTGAASQCPGGKPSSTCDPVNANFDANVQHVADPIALAGSSKEAGEFEVFNSPASATAIWGKSVVTDAAATNFIWDFYVYVNSSNYWSHELDLYDTLDKDHFMMGNQCSRGRNAWDTWSSATSKWIDHYEIPCSTILSPNKWHHLTIWNTIIPSAKEYEYRVLRIDGVDYVINQKEQSSSDNWPSGLIGVQVQLDLNSTGTGVKEFIENMNLHYW
jgi:hypothetical protein